MVQRGIATFSLDYGKCPRWLFERMVNLGREIIWVIVEQYGPEEFIKRIADPVWFQSLGTLLAFDWNSSGLTTILTAALKQAVEGMQEDIGIFICGGKGKTSKKTPDEIQNWTLRAGIDDKKTNALVYNSKMAAKVDSALVQDGFQIYHHSFLFTKTGVWAVVQQGMNINNQTARRYHWYSEKVDDLVCEPHSGIVSQKRNPTLNLTAKQSEQTRQISAELVQSNYVSLMKDIQILRKHSSELSHMLCVKFKQRKFTFLRLENKEFFWHPVLRENFLHSKYLQRILYRVCEIKPQNYEKLLSLKGVGPKTIRALALVSELIYGAKPSYEDPARYSFAHGGKDYTPYPVDRQTYDSTIEFFDKIIHKMKIPISEKKKMTVKLWRKKESIS